MPKSILLGAKWRRIIKFTYPINFIGGPNRSIETLNFLIRKWKPCFSRICQKVEDWLQLFSRSFPSLTLFSHVHATMTHSVRLSVGRSDGQLHFAFFRRFNWFYFIKSHFTFWLLSFSVDYRTRLKSVGKRWKQNIRVKTEEKTFRKKTTQISVYRFEKNALNLSTSNPCYFLAQLKTIVLSFFFKIISECIRYGI